MRPGGGPDLPAEQGSAAAQLGASPSRHFYRGRNPERALSIQDLRAMAHRFLPDLALEYLEGGAEEEAALAGNRAAFHRWQFLPRALAGAGERDLGCTLFGRRLPLPIVIAPTGLNGLFRRGADSRLAAAAAAMDVPFVQSAMSNESVEAVARMPKLRHWFQLYVMNRDDITEDLIGRAEKAGCEALVVTTDAQIFGGRSWSMRDFAGPTRPRLRTVVDAAWHVRWWAATLRPSGLPRFGNYERWIPSRRKGLFDSAFWIRDHMDVGLDWDRVARIRDRWRRPLVVKGLLAPEDVDRAARIGADAVVMSNHGGRQLDWTVAPLDVVAQARSAADGRLEVMMDGGVRTGADIVKAVALGARAVLVGRAALYGVAAAGEAGVVRAVAILREELDRDLAFLGCRSLNDLDPSLLVAQS